MGGQSINAFDYAMAEGIRKSFKKAIIHETEKALFYSEKHAALDKLKEEIEKNPCGYGNPATVDTLNNILQNTYLSSKIYSQACCEVEEETHQAMEALIHNFNTLHSRTGSQVEQCLCA